MLNRKTTILGALVVLLVVGAIVIYLVFSKKPTTQPTNDQTQVVQEKLAHDPCLSDDEYADYPRKNKDIAVLTSPLSVPVVVFVYNKKSGEKKDVFEIGDVQENHYHPIELHRCGVYATRIFNFDWQSFKPMSGFAKELWQYSYDGSEKKIFTFSALNSILFFNDDFRIDLKEKFLSLTRGYLGKDNYALIIKDLKTIEDTFTLTITDIEKRNPDLVDDISLDGWTKDSRYFWARTHSGANVLGFIRIDIQTKTFELFPAPENVLGGDALNIEKGLITVHPNNVWYGIADVTEQEKADRRKQGMGTELYIENLFTKKRQLVAKTNEPLNYFKPQWISDTELQYEMPSGEKKVHKIK